MKRILVVRTSALGDTVLVTPVLRALWEKWPGAEIHFVTSGAFAPLFEGLPFVSRVWRWEPKGRHVGLRGLTRFAREVRASGPFDLALDLQNKVRTRALLALVRPKKKLAFVKRRGVAALARALFGRDRVIDRGPQAALYFETFASLGLGPSHLLPEISLPETARAAADRLLEPAEGAPIVALAPGARWDLKKWPAERFAEVGDALAKRGARLILAGGPGDVAELEALRQALGHQPIGDTVGLDVAGLAAVLARAAVVITNDSAPSHLAQAVGIPVVAIFGPTSAKRWGPLDGAGTSISLPLSCAPCSNHGKGGCPLGHHRCMADLPSDPVIAAAVSALGEVPTRTLPGILSSEAQG